MFEISISIITSQMRENRNADSPELNQFFCSKNTDKLGSDFLFVRLSVSFRFLTNYDLRKRTTIAVVSLLKFNRDLKRT